MRINLVSCDQKTVHKSPAKKTRNFKRLVSFLNRKLVANSLSSMPNLSKCSQTTLSISSKNFQNLSLSKPVIIDIPPYHQEGPSGLNPEEILNCVQHLQTEVEKAKLDFQEMVKLKNEHIQILMNQIKTLPGIILGQLQTQMQPP